MEMCKEYPSWEDVRADVSIVDLRDIIDTAFDVGLDTAIQDYIEANYEPTLVPDVDAAYEAYRDENR